MADEYNPTDPEEIKAEFDRRWEELRESLRSGLVHDPVTAAIASIFTVKALLGIGLSVGISLGVGALTRALTPRQKLERGRMGGEVFAQRAGQGEFIAEVYGADPATNATVFTTSTALALNTRVIPSVGYSRYYRVTTAGTTGGSAPTWSSTKGATVTSGTVVFTDMGETGGGVRLGPILLWMPPTKPIRMHRNPGGGSRGGGKGGPKQPEVTEITYDTDLGHLWCRGPALLKKMWAAAEVLLDLTPDRSATFVFDPATLTDSAYDHKLPPNPEDDYTLTIDRFDGGLVDDGLGGRTGTVSGGANANIAIYEGNATQLQDPTIEAATDAKYGAGSTPAYRWHCYSLLKNFYLTRYQGAIPPFTGLVESKTVLTLKQLGEHQCGRVALLSTDYDFSGLTTVDLRGVLLNSRYTPKGILEQLAPLYNAYFYESDKIYGKLKGQASVATIDDSKIGWSEEDSEADVLPEVDYEYPVETDVPRRVELRYIDPARDFEPNMHGSARQITTSERIETLEVQVALTSEEAREITDRLLYETEVEAVPIRFTLSWEYLWLNAGDTITVTRDEGFTETVQLTSIKKCIGPLECEAVRVESAVFTQPAVAQGSQFEVPPVPIAGMTIVSFFNVPLLRDSEGSVNGGSGFYAAATKRTGDGAFNGAGLYVDKGLDYELIGTFELPATMGRTVGALTASTTTADVVADAVTVDLYGTDATLESVTREQLMLGAGACIVGDEVCQILTATNVSDVDHPNRWDLVIGLRGRRGTEDKVSTHVAGERFVVINDALKFIPVNRNEVNLPRTYKAVTAGQSLADAAEVDFTWTGVALKALSPVNASRKDDSADNSLIEFSGRGRFGHGIHAGLSAHEEWEVAQYELEVCDGTGAGIPIDPPRVLRAGTGMSQAALLISDGANKFTNISVNTVTQTGIGETRAIALQQITRSGNFVEATLNTSGNANLIGFGLVSPVADWRTATALTADYYAQLEGSGLNVALVFYAFGAPIYSEIVSTSTDYRIRITLSGSEVRFTKNYVNAGSSAQAVSPIAPVFPLRPFIRNNNGIGGTTEVEKMILTTDPHPKTIYTAAQQTEDFGSAQASIELNIYQVLPGIGRGNPLHVTLTDSL